VLAGRRERAEFHWFLDEIASVAVGGSIADQVKCVKLPSEWLSPSLEAFCLLCVENYLEHIQSKVRNDEPPIRAKWTADGRGSKKNQGWKQEGIQQYNILLEHVRSDRVAYPKEDEVYLRMKQEETTKWECEKLRKRQEAGAGKQNELLAAEDDFSSDSECD
jgi:hypothetical protein